jgi:hypothetical protein
MVMIGGECGYIDTSGKVVIQVQYLNALNFSEGIASVCNLNGLWGYIDKEGKEVLAFKYNYAGAFSNGNGRVLYNSKWYMIDRFGKLSKIED